MNTSSEDVTARPVIGIITNFDHDPHYFFPGYRRLTINEDYSRSITAAGGVPVLIPSGADHSTLPTQLSLLDGLVLSGGPDVAPLLYGQAPKKECQTPTPVRDAFELEALRIARDMGLPVFGICRGMQMINVFLGGTLFQDLRYAGTGDMHMAEGNPSSPIHLVHLDGESFLTEAWGETAEVAVNSFHHQAVDRVADGLRVVARAHDGLVEAVESVRREAGGLDVCAVQWHPEMMSEHDERAQQLFRWLVSRMPARTRRP